MPHSSDILYLTVLNHELERIGLDPLCPLHGDLVRSGRVPPDLPCWPRAAKRTEELTGAFLALLSMQEPG
jgi:hypothetical protein